MPNLIPLPTRIMLTYLMRLWVYKFGRWRLLCFPPSSCIHAPILAFWITNDVQYVPQVDNLDRVKGNSMHCEMNVQCGEFNFGPKGVNLLAWSHLPLAHSWAPSASNSIQNVINNYTLNHCRFIQTWRMTWGQLDDVVAVALLQFSRLWNYPFGHPSDFISF